MYRRSYLIWPPEIASYARLQPTIRGQCWMNSCGGAVRVYGRVAAVQARRTNHNMRAQTQQNLKDLETSCFINECQPLKYSNILPQKLNVKYARQKTGENTHDNGDPKPPFFPCYLVVWQTDGIEGPFPSLRRAVMAPVLRIKCRHDMTSHVMTRRHME